MTVQIHRAFSDHSDGQNKWNFLIVMKEKDFFFNSTFLPLYVNEEIIC